MQNKTKQVMAIKRTKNNAISNEKMFLQTTKENMIESGLVDNCGAYDTYSGLNF